MNAVPITDLFAWHRALRDANQGAGQTGGRGVVLSRQALALAFVIGTYMDREGTTPARSSPGLDKLSQALGYPATDKRKAVSGLLRELQRAGYLIVTTRVGRAKPNLYTAAAPASVACRIAGEGAPHGDAHRRAQPPAGTQPGPSEHLGAATSPAAPAQQIGPENAVFNAGNCGGHTAHPSSNLSLPSPGGTTQTSNGASDRDAASQVVWQALQQLPPELALKVSDSIRGLHSRAEMARRINALCAAGRQAEVVRELARPYDEAHNPGAVAAARIKALCADIQAARHV